MTQEQLEFWRKMGYEMCPECNNRTPQLWELHTGRLPGDYRLKTFYSNRSTGEVVYRKPNLNTYYCEECDHKFEGPID